VLDFFVAEDGCIWTLLDGNWTEEGSQAIPDEITMVKIIVFAGGQVSAIDGPKILTRDNFSSSLKVLPINSLHFFPRSTRNVWFPVRKPVLLLWITTNSPLGFAGNPSDLQALDPYALLSSMPKNAEVEHNPMDRDVSETALVDEDSLVATLPGKKLSKKELGRLKHKAALKSQAKTTLGEDSGEDKPKMKKTRSIPCD